MIYERINNNYQIVKTNNQFQEYNNIVDLSKSKKIIICCFLFKNKTNFIINSLLYNFVRQKILPYNNRRRSKL